MKHKHSAFFLALALGASAALAGCSSPSVMTHKDGSQEMTPDKPEYDKDSGFYQYECNGAEVQVNKDEVQRIEEVK